MICQFILRTASSFPCAEIQPVELFDCSGAELIDGCSLTLQLFHQVEGAVLVRVQDHLIHYKLLMEELNQLTIQFVVPEKRQDTFTIMHPSISFSNICSSSLPLKGETIYR